MEPADPEPRSAGHGPERELVLAIDMGTSGPKVCLIDDRGQLLGHEFRPTKLLLLDGGGQEQRPEDWWNAIHEATLCLLSRRVANAARIRYIAVTSQWSGTVAVDRQGQPLRNAIGWMDTRGAPHVAKITAGFPQVARYALPRLLRWIQLTGGAPGHSGKDSLAHILWLKHEAPELYHGTHKFLEPKDWINCQLTGRMAAGYDSIALHFATDNRRIDDIRYHPALLQMAGLSVEKLPELARSTDVLGTLRPQLAAEWGLDRSVQVVVGTPDVHAAAVGSGGVENFDPHLYVGTSSWLTCHVPFKKTSLAHNMASLPSAIPGRYLVMNEQETAGACMTWLRDGVFMADDGPGTAPPPVGSYAALDRLAQAAAPGSGKLIFTPWLVGERTPIDDPHVRGGWFNLSLRTTRAELVRSVMEGVALNARGLLRALEKFCNQPFRSLRIIGGGAQSATWCQIYADVLGVPIHQMADPVAAGARGAACLALVGAGKLSFRAFGDAVQVAQVFEPQHAHQPVYDELFAEFQRLYKANRSTYRRLNRHASRRAPAGPRE